MCGKQRFVISLVLLSSLIATSVTPAADSGLVGWWKFDEGAGTATADSSRNGNDGTIVGAAWTAPGWDQRGYCLEFLYADNESDLVDVGTMDVVGEGITISGWVNPYSFTQNDARVISKSSTGATADGHWWMLSTLNGVNVRFRLKTNENNTTLTLIDTAGVLVAGEWQFVTARWDGARASTYVNTVETGSAAKGGTAVATDSTVPVAIGNQPAAAGDGPRAWDGLIDDVRVYNRALTMEELAEVMSGGGPGANTELASAPAPADGQADVPRDVVLGWAAGEFARTHDVYLGMSLDDVSAADRANPLGVLVSEGQTGLAYEPPVVFEYGQTYYWRVDEVNAAPDDTIFKGDVWSFRVEPYAYAITGIIATASHAGPGAGPENTINGSGLNDNDEHSIDAADMWLAAPSGADPVWIQYEFDRLYKLYEMLVWNYNVQFELVLGFGLKDVTLEYSEDGADWSTLGDVELAKATATADYTANTTVDLQGVGAKFLRLNVNSGWGPMGQFGLSEVRISQVPVFAREPQPADGATGVDPETLLSWRSGREAAMHEVYFSTEEAAVVDGTALVDTVGGTTAAPGSLNLGTMYYWKISEVNEAEAISVWEGDVWSFSTQEYFVVDDFESYDDEDNAIFDTWLDGFVNGTGSTVGYFEAPFAEQTIVNSGSQSMPLEYANDAAPFYSEAEFDLGGMDLDTNGADTLRLFVAGQAPAFAETADGTIVMNAIGVDIWNTADEFRYAYKTLNGDGSMVARVDSLVDSDVWAKGGVMIRETTDAGSAFAAVYMTGDNGVRFQGRLTTDPSAVSDTSVATAAQIYLRREPVWVKIERVGNAFNGYYSVDGENWVDMTWNPQTIDMAATVTIGLALTAHNAAVTTGAAFAGVAESGGVSGNWQIAEIGVAQPTTGNAIEPLYVALEDTSGNVAVVTHPNPAAVGIAGWQEWLIPYSDLAGIKLNRVATMYIGVGDRDNPTAGGAGLIFIDDIGFGRPAAAEWR